MKFRQAEKLKGEDIDNNIILHISVICSQKVASPERRMRIFLVDDMRFLTKEFASVQSDVGNYTPFKGMHNNKYFIDAHHA